MKAMLFCIFLLAAIPAVAVRRSGKPVTITVLYDNYVYKRGTTADWGFCCLIEGTEKTILFDTGTNPEILKHNAGMLGVDFGAVDIIVLSHNHGDHTGGLDFVLGITPEVTVYFPKSFPEAFSGRVEERGARPVRVGEPVWLCSRVWTTGEIPGPVNEQALILDTAEGPLLITGCSHPGIAGIVEKTGVLLKKPVHTVVGGFHLMQHSREQVEEIARAFKKLGVIRCGATHCTGDNAIAVFKDVFADNYLPMGVGRCLHVDLAPE